MKHSTPSSENISIHNQNKMVLRATYAAIAASSILLVSKFINYFLTGSVAIYGSALDSLNDLVVSFANFFTAYFLRKKANKTFPNGYAKLAPLVAVLEVCLVVFLSIMLLFECYQNLYEPREIESVGLGAAIIIFALFVNLILVMYQKKVVKKTGSIIIKADMLHYQTDFLTNFAILAGIICMSSFGITWLDPILGAVAAFYIFFAVIKLFKTAISSLLEVNNSDLSHKIHEFCVKNDIAFDSADIYVLFSGTHDVAYLKIASSDLGNAEKAKVMIEANFKLPVIVLVK